ncbi:hypothetical protein Tbd_1827 [Thiobacillus denitrificans ATCC 25259]|uniref:Uncharacterized protein n=1 Tax=Thiobacillus denitrificans (strain ATCC 25259 / T1) TaxID=292415 RepID=Q3SHV3_THIDA|nr:hypothetical protein [Thiobacillus denitrificans]AAZ97780.1 hypothetical protein Tbd_1827 [Thiobacillus denitrificans ATCC 25259]
MNAPDQLVEQWTPMMRMLAHTTGADLDDIKQEAWLLAATMPRRHDGDFVTRWLAAVHCHAAAQRPGVTVRPSARRTQGEEYIGTAWLAGSIGDDPCAAIQAAETVARRVCGNGDAEARWQRIRQEIELPRTSAEIARARGVSERQGRRQAAVLQALERVQADLLAADESGVSA